MSEVEKIATLVVKRTEKALEEWRWLTSLTGVEKTQLLFDLSTWECNKPIIAELYHPGEALDTRSDRRVNIIFPVGTMIEFYSLHDKHNYPVPSHAIVCNSSKWGEDKYGKMYMTALAEDGGIGSLLYIYNPFTPVFAPVERSKKFIVDWLEKVIMNTAKRGETLTALQRIVDWKETTNGKS